jgi:hypothetical protein
MSSAAQLAPEAIERLYQQRIRPALLDPIGPARTPVALIVGGQPGAGKTLVIQRLRRELARDSAEPLVISGDTLRAFHPGWAALARSDPYAVDATRHATDRWSERLAAEGLARRTHLVFHAGMLRPQPVRALADTLQAHGYRIEVGIVAAPREASRLASLLRYERLLSLGAAPRFIPAAHHERAYDALAEAVARLDRAPVFARFAVLTADGRVLYEQRADAPRPEASAAQALAAYRDRLLPARELADHALRWHTLAARLQARAAQIPREVIVQALEWRAQATHQAMADPQARELYEAGLAAEALRTLPAAQFAREFPAYRTAANKVERAREYAESQYTLREERARFVAIARERVAEQIEAGRQAGRGRGRSEEPAGR